MRGRFSSSCDQLTRPERARPSSGFKPPQDVGTKRIADHDETLRGDTVGGTGWPRRRQPSVTDDFDIPETAKQADVELGALWSRSPFVMRHQRRGRGSVVNVSSAPETVHLFGEHLLREIDEIAQSRPRFGSP